jgi:hypothetical protein
MHYLFYRQNASGSVNHPQDFRQYPEVNTRLFKQSAAKAITLMEDVNIVMRRITVSDDFSNKLMTAAQQSNQAEVDRLIQSAGIKIKPKITYNPDGITMNFQDFVGEKECCHIILQLRWL